MTITIGPPTSDDDIIVHARLSQMAFYDNPIANPDPLRTRIDEALLNRRMIRVGDQVAGGYAIISMGQFFGGRSVPMAGIGGVVIAPEHRSSGLGSRLLRDLLQQCHQRGFPISTLYPASQPVYRKAGYEQAGANIRYRVPVSAFTHVRRPADLTVRAITADDANALRSLQAQAAQRADGNTERSSVLWEWIQDQQHTAVDRFLVLRGETPVGYILFGIQRDAKGDRNIAIRDLVALDRGAARAIIALLGGHMGNVDNITWWGPAIEPLLLDITNPGHPSHDPTEYEVWMTRIVDVPKALAARGYPAHVQAELHLDITDDILSANTGRWLVRISGGKATVEPGGDGRIKATPRGLAPVYTSYLSPLAVRDPEHLDGPDTDLHTMATAFAGTPPWMPDHF